MKYSVHVSYNAPSAASAAFNTWLGVPGGEALATPDGALLKARRHVREYAGASCLIRRGAENLWLVQRGAVYDLATGRAVYL